MPAGSDSKLTEQAKTFEWLAYIAATLLAIQLLFLLNLLHLIDPLIQALTRGAWAEFWDEARPILRKSVTFLPVYFYVGALFSLADIFGRVAEGQLFSPANSKGLAEVGSSLLWGAAAGAVIVPNVLSAIDRSWDFSGIYLEPEFWVIAVIGGALLVLGRMMAQAQSENAALKAELSDFV